MQESKRIDLPRAILTVAMKVVEIELSRVGGTFTQDSAVEWYNEVVKLSGVDNAKGASNG